MRRRPRPRVTGTAPHRRRRCRARARGGSDPMERGPMAAGPGTEAAGSPPGADGVGPADRAPRGVMAVLDRAAAPAAARADAQETLRAAILATVTGATRARARRAVPAGVTETVDIRRQGRATVGRGQPETPVPRALARVPEAEPATLAAVARARPRAVRAATGEPTEPAVVRAVQAVRAATRAGPAVPGRARAATEAVPAAMAGAAGMAEAVAATVEDKAAAAAAGTVVDRRPWRRRFSPGFDDLRRRQARAGAANVGGGAPARPPKRRGTKAGAYLSRRTILRRPAFIARSRRVVMPASDHVAFASLSRPLRVDGCCSPG